MRLAKLLEEAMRHQQAAQAAPGTIEWLLYNYGEPGQNAGGFNLLRPEVQQAILTNPDVFLAGNRGWNQENNSIFSIGAEGGYNEDAYRNAQWDPQRGLILDPSGFLQVHDDGPFGGGFLGDIATLGLGSAAFGVGGATGASPFTGQSPEDALLLDAAGLATGFGLSGAMGGSAAAGGTAGADITAGAAGGDLALGGTNALTDAQLLEMAGITPTYSGVAAPFTLPGSEAAFPWLSNAPAGSVFAASSAVPAASWLSGAPELAGTGLEGVVAESGGGLTSFLPSLGDIFGTIRGALPSADTAAALAPILAAIAYARNQGPFDTSRLTSTYDQFQPDALAFEYDQNTARGRDALTSSLTNRGVMGSSFGNMDITNFQTSRDLGRRSLVNQGLAARGGIANSIIDAEAKERALKNQLYGTSLLALGNVFGGRNQQTQQPQQQSSKSIFDRLFG
jgi:hypothetical protein